MHKKTFDKSDYDQFIAKFIHLLQLNNIKLGFTSIERWIADGNDPAELIDFSVMSKEYVASYLAQKASEEVINIWEAKKYSWYLIEVKVPSFEDGYYIQQFKMGAK
jgi:hypothetical protein